MIVAVTGVPATAAIGVMRTPAKMRLAVRLRINLMSFLSDLCAASALPIGAGRVDEWLGSADSKRDCGLGRPGVTRAI
jgi:hypothetical protein